MAYYFGISQERMNLLNYDAWKTVSLNGCSVGSYFDNNGVTLIAAIDDAYNLYDAEYFPEDARIYCNEGDVFTLSWEEETNTSGRVYIFGYNGVDNGYVTLSGVNNADAKEVTYVVPAGVKFITYRFGVENAGNAISYKNIMLNRSSVAYPYTPYEYGLIRTYDFNSDALKVKHFNNDNVFTSGADVVYHVDTGVAYIEEVDSGASVLNPTSFTPTKDGWAFIGWREDAVANSDVLSSKVMENSVITLWAVFGKDCTTTCISYNSTQYVRGTAYYNNGNITEANGYIPVGADYSGWVWRGWTNGLGGNDSAIANVTFGNGDWFTFDGDYTIYGLYEKNYNIAFISYNKTENLFYTRYYNASGNVYHPVVTAPNGADYPGWTWRGWSYANDTAANGTVNFGNGFSYSDDGDGHIRYGLYEKIVTETFIDYSVESGGVHIPVSSTTYYNSAGNTKYSDITAPNGGYWYDGWTFQGWGYPDNGGYDVNVMPGYVWTSTNDCVRSAIYTKTVTLYYNGNGANSGGVDAQSGTAYCNVWAGNRSEPTFSLRANGYSRTGHMFTKWQFEDTGWLYNAGDSVTLGSDATFYAQWVQSEYNFGYTGDVQAFTAPISGRYSLQVWGAQGAYAENYAGDDIVHAPGGFGGYAYGYVWLDAGATVYICVGGKPLDNTFREYHHNDHGYAGGYNGGGKGDFATWDSDEVSVPGGWPATGGASGGGATHMATTNRGILANYASYTSEVLLVAGGGGGGTTGYSNWNGDGQKGGTGGGASGGHPLINWNDEVHTDTSPGTQSSGYAFGQGAGPITYGGGGGGGWYGGNTGMCCGGAGGSGYIGGVSDGGMGNGIQDGNGYARITLTQVA